MVGKLTKRGNLRYLFLILGVVLLILLVLIVGPTKILNETKNANLRYIVLGIFVYLILSLCRASKWLLILRETKEDVCFRDIVPIYFMAFIISIVTPARSGEIVVPFLLKSRVGTPVGKGFAVVIVDRILEMLVLVGLILIGAIYFAFGVGLESGVYKQIIFAIFFFIVVILLFLFGISSEKRLNYIANCIKRLFKNRFAAKKIAKMQKEIQEFSRSLKLIKNGKTITKLVALTLLAWFLVGVSTYFIIKSIADVRLLEVAFSSFIATGVGLVTFIPLGLGAFAVSFTYLMTLFGYSTAKMASGSILTRIFLTGFMFLCAILASTLSKPNKKQIKIETNNKT